MNNKLTLFIVYFAIIFSSFAQVSESEIQKVKKDIANQNFRSAVKKLESIYNIEKSNVSVNWLYAYTLSQLGKYKESKAMYENTLDLLPNSNELKLEYAQTLMKMGKLNDALNVVQGLKSTRLEQSTVLLTEAEILFWNGEYAKSKDVLSELDKKYPKNSISKDLKNRISKVQSVYISISADYVNDNQPMDAVTESLKIGKMQSHKIHPSIEIKNVNYSNNAQNTGVLITNEFLFASVGIGSKITAGVEYNRHTDKKNLVGSFTISKSVVNKAKLTLGAERLTYKSTLESTLKDLMYNKGFISFDYGNYNQSLLHIGYDYNFFDDENTIQYFGAWYISKPLFDSKFKIQAGYGFGYSDAKKSTYTPTLTQSGLFFNTNTSVTSKYNLYYTPNNQIVNSVVLVLKYPITKQFEITAKGNYGFYASTLSPQYTVSNGNSTTPTYSENKTNFNPFETALSLEYNLSQNLSIKAQTAYSKTYFYDSFNAGLRLDYKF